MSRLFDGVNDIMTYGSVPSAINVTGATTFLAVIRQITTDDTAWQSYIECRTSASAVSASLGRKADGNIYYTNGTVTAFAVQFTDSEGWAVVAATRTTGAAQDPIFYRDIIAGATTTASNAGAPVDNAASITGGSINLGGPSDFAGIRLAAAAIFTRVLSQAEVESIDTARSTQAIYDLTPVWLVDDDSTFAADYMGNANRTAITGTADDGDDPSGWVYGLDTSGPSQRFMWMP